MNHRQLVELTGAMPWFDLPLLAQAFDEPREIIRLQLSRWMKLGRVIGLRRGMYTLPETYRRVPVIPAVLANQLYHPSYLSGPWALGFHDLIPERVVWLTSVTTRVPRRFENSFGIFEYRNIRADCFTGYRTAPYGSEAIHVADPEKALLDHWRLTPGEWTLARISEMRYQNTEGISAERLHAFADRFRSPRLFRAVLRWLNWRADQGKGTVEL